MNVQQSEYNLSALVEMLKESEINDSKTKKDSKGNDSHEVVVTQNGVEITL
ncbi:hypothetical protein JW865_04545 [Candidatus Bathyarchaeota archaeon]|nr:hypothetical protein [Candidatus Bathyarchaeota archaeon]